MRVKDITIAIPVYERTEFFKEAIESAINQTVKCTIIVVDNASTHDYFSKYISKFADPNITYYRNDENLGMVGNWNRCIELTQTKYISILNDDDALHPQFIEYTHPFLNGKNIVVCSDSLIDVTIPRDFDIRIGNSPKMKSFKKTKFLFGNLTPSVGSIYPIETARKIGSYDIDFYPAQDYHFWIKMASAIPVYKLDKKLAFYRISQNQTSNQVYNEIISKTYEIRKELGAYRYLKLLSLYNLYLLYKFYSNDKRISEDRGKLNPELYSKFDTIEKIEQFKLVKAFLRFFYKNAMRLLKLTRTI